MVFTKFHYPVEKDNILVGNENEYESSLKPVSDFKIFIEKIYNELDKYSDEDLNAIGIETNRKFKGSGEGIFKLKLGNTNYKISKHKYPQGISVTADQYEAENTLIEIITSGRIMSYLKVFDFYGEKFAVGNNNSEHSFSFSTQEKNINEIINGAYLEVCLPHPLGKIEYDKNRGQYTVKYKTQEEKPIEKRIYAEYENADGTPYRSNPFAATTYPSFKEAISDLEKKTQTFQNAWNNALIILKETNAQHEIAAVKVKKI